MKHKFIDVLKTFTQTDIDDFGDFLDSPFLNKSKKVTKLYKVLLEFYPNFEESDLSDEKINNILNPLLPFNKSTIKALFSNLYTKSKEYFKIKNFLNRRVESSDFLRDELFKRKLFREIENNIDEVETSLKNDCNINADYFINRFKIANDKANLSHIFSPKSNIKSVNTDSEYILERGKYLVYFFIAEIIREYDNLITIAKTFSLLNEENLIFQLFSKINLTEILDFVIAHEKDKKYISVFEIYNALLYSILNFENESSYFKYKKVLIQNIDSISKDEIRFHFRGLIKNCLLRREISSDSKYIDNELFKLYNFILENGFYKSSMSEYLTFDLYRNVLVLALRQKKFKWVLEFIKNYNLVVDPKKKKNIYNYSFAEYYFTRKNYKSALSYFQKIKNDEFIIKMDMRNQMLIANYELCNFEAALSMIDSYSFFLSYDRTLSSSKKNLYKNFVKIVKLLIQYNTSPNITSNTEIELFSNNDIPFKEWVLEKVIETYNTQKNKDPFKKKSNITYIRQFLAS